MTWQGTTGEGVTGESAAGHCAEGNAFRARRQWAAAIGSYRKAIALQPDFPEAHHALGLSFRALGQLDAAACCYRQTAILRPDLPQPYLNLGLARQSQGLPAEADVCYRRALAIDPASAPARFNLGNVLGGRGRAPEAIACYRSALALAPEYVEAYVNLGNALQERRCFHGALTVYGHALAIGPGRWEGWLNRGSVLRELGPLEEAARSCRTAIALAPGLAQPYCNLGLVMRDLGEPAAAAELFEKALRLTPDYAECRLHRVVAVLPVLTGTVSESVAVPAAFEAALDGLIDWARGHLGALGKVVGAGQPFHLAYRPGEHRHLLSRFGTLSAAAAEACWQPGLSRPVPASESAGRRIRIGIVSAHIRHHPVWDVVVRGIVEHLNRQEFEIHLYHTQAETDGETAWAARRARRFVQGPKPMEAWLDAIAADRPDVLFYPEIGMDPLSSALAALRLAPLQAAGWGHPITTGLPTIDLFLSGALLEGEDAAGHYREKLVLLPGTGVCTASPVGYTARLDRQAFGLPADRRIVCFALCQTPFKFDPLYDDLYARIAEAAAPCQFWLPRDAKYPWASERLAARLAGAFRARGLAPDSHLRLMPWQPGAAFGRFLEEADVLLDCPAFSGFTTAWAAAHRGLPIITFEGRFLRQRLAAGLLRRIGQTDGIVATEEDYLALATRWAEECRRPGDRAARRQAMRRSASVADGDLSAVRAFERAMVDGLSGRI